MRRVVLASWIFIIGLSGCELRRESKPSVLVIAVEGLGFETLSCDSEPTGGLQILCDEAVRFSHAFSPSTMSQATLSSLLTGLYPLDHGVRHNGPDFLSSRFQTLAEVALSQRYHTLFVSGGPPIWRKSGLAQGFEIFDDQVDISPGNSYRPAHEVFRLATQWIDHEISRQPFFSLLFLADLQFPQIATKTSDGEVRERSEAGQLEEITDSLGGLFQWLKARKLWNSTHVVVVGLNSFTRSEGETEPQPLSLRSNSAQVSLFIKPARKERDEPVTWAIDRNVSLVDVGATIFQWLGKEAPAASLPALQPRSLASAFVKPDPSWDEDRLIVSETAWPDWLEGSGVRWAIRQIQFLYIHDRKPLVFNTLTDHAENLRIKSSDPLWSSVNGEVLNLVSQAKVAPFKGMQPHWPDQLEVAHELWRDGLMSRTAKGGEPWAKWYLREALRKRDWKAVKRLAQGLGDPIGAFVAARQLGENLGLPRNACIRMLFNTKGENKSLQSECEDERLLALHAWKNARGDEEKAAAQERFGRLMAHSYVDQEIGRMNYLMDLRWDVDREQPEAPQVVDYLLTLKEFESFNKKTSSFAGAKDARL